MFEKSTSKYLHKKVVNALNGSKTYFNVEP